MPDAIPFMIEALGIELAEIRKRGGSKQIDLRTGERVGTAENHHLYRFPLTDDFDVRDETPIRLIVGSEETDGIVVSFKDNWLTIAISEDLGAIITVARLIADDSFLIERLKVKLEEIAAGSTTFNRASAERIIGDEHITSADTEPAPHVWSSPMPNRLQCLAVRRALGSNATFIWGPPGTGKTMAVARIVEAFYRAGQSVLLVSNTNIAVDTALQRIVERLHGEPEFHEGAVLRHGPIVKDELKQNSNRISIDDVVARLGESIKREVEQLHQTITAKEREVQSARTGARLHETAALQQEQITVAERTLSAIEQRASDLKCQQVARQQRITNLRHDLLRAEDAGLLKRLFTGLNPARLTRDITDTARDLQSIESALASTNTSIRPQHEELQRLRQQWQSTQTELKPYPPLQTCRAHIEAVESETASLRQRVQTLDGELAALKQKVVSNCRVLATTVYRTYLPGQVERQFDVVIIDEASMLMLPMSYYAAGRAETSVVVAGDFRQLPPIVMSDESICEEWLKQDVFVKTGIPGMVRSGSAPDFLIALEEQFRMDDEICNCISHFFYPEHPLTTIPRDISLAHNPMLGRQLSYIDTSEHNPWAAVRLGTYSRYNLFHALLVRNIAVNLFNQGYITSDDPERLGITSPYGAQVKLLQSLIEEKIQNRIGHDLATTVHRFQGNERDTIIVDLTESYGYRLGRFMKGSQPEDEGTRLLNVALSRGRGHVILVANFRYLRDKAPADSIVQRLLNHFEGQGVPLDIHDLLPLGDADWIDGMRRLNVEGFEFPEGMAGFFSASNFYPAFSADLVKASKYVAIFSPFMTEHGFGRWADYFHTAITRGVMIRLVTRPPGDQGGVLEQGLSELIARVRQHGVIVDLRSRMHEKVVLIDDQVAWHGSLNVMSHSDTQEAMMRVPGAAICHSLARFLSTPGNNKDDEPDIRAQENPSCPECGRATIWNIGKYGIYFKCEDSLCGCTVDASRRGQRRNPLRGERTSRNSARQSSADAGTRRCPLVGCDGTLRKRDGRFGQFWGCSNYPRCRYTEDVKG